MMTEDEIVREVGKCFRCFGGDTSEMTDNPLAYAFAKEPLMFNFGVNVTDVVQFVIKLYSTKVEEPIGER